VGSTVVNAHYSGDKTWTPADATLTIVVAQASTATTISVSFVDGHVTLSGAVSAIAPGSGTPTGTLHFVNTADNSEIATSALAGGKAQAGVAIALLSGRAIAAVYSGDANFKPSSSSALPAPANAAGNPSGDFSADEIVSLFGVAGLSGDNSGRLPLTTSLGGVTVTIVDSAGTQQLATLYGVFGAAGQINFVLPAGLAPGPAEVLITLPGGVTVTTAINIAGSAPGIFTANQNGKGPYAGQVIRVHADGSQVVTDAATFRSDTNTFVPTPISLGTAGDQVYLVLYGTGIRHAASVTATVNGVTVPVIYTGAQGTFPGMDQLNVGPLPTSLAGAGVVNLVITVDGQTANTVTVNLQ